MKNIFVRRVYELVVTRYFAGLWLFYCVCLFTILRADRLYLDDLGRALYGYADWIASARPLAELCAWLFYLGPTTVDASPFSQILAAGFLALASLLLLDAVRVRPSWGAVLCVVPVGLSPYGLENLSYCFDSPWMALALVLALTPCRFFQRSGRVFFILTCACLFASASLYQPALGGYLAVATYAVLVDLVSRKRMTLVIRTLVRFAAPFCVGVGIYAVQAPFWFGASQQYTDYVSEHAVLPSPLGLPGVLAANAVHYCRLLWRDWNGNGIGVLIGITAVGFAMFLLRRHWRSLRLTGRFVESFFRLLLLFAGLGCFFLSPFGIQHALASPIWAPRTFQGFGVMAALMLLFLYDATKRMKLRKVFQGVQILLILQLIIFAQVYGNLLGAQGAWELSRMALLASDLNKFIRATGSNRVDFVGSVGLSPLVRTPARKYPLLERLVTVPLTRDWRWGYEQLNTYGVKVDRENISAGGMPPGNMALFLETPVYRIEVTPDNVGIITFLQPPEPKPLVKKAVAPK